MTRPPDLFLTFRMGTILILVVPVLCLHFAVAQNAVRSSSWTFKDPAVSHMRFTPPLSITKVLKLELSFRTLLPNALLVYKSVSNQTYQQEGDMNEEEIRLLQSYRLVVELHQGHLRVGHMFDHFKDIVSVGRALNNDKWHTIKLSVNQTSGEMVVTLDSSPVTEYLKAYIWGNARVILDASRVHTALQFGGEREVRSLNYNTFIGCLRDMKYSVDSAILQDIPMQEKEGVFPGCLNQCQMEERCQNGGNCVNLYTDFHCDCYGTGFQGRSCEQSGPTVLTFSGYEWVTYRLYQGEDNRPFSDNNRVSLEFKTQQSSGILLYAVGGSPYHNHITAALHSGVLHVSLAFGEDDLNFPLGSQLNDNRWHNLTIEHIGRLVSVHLDGTVTRQSITSSDFFISLDPLAYFGGGEKFVVTRGLPVTKSFVGCLRNVYFYDQSVLYQLAIGTDNCVYRGGEKPTFGCNPVRDVPISFPNAASALRWNLGSRGENLVAEFEFRTIRKDGIMFYMELVSQRDNGGSDYGIMEVWVMKGQPLLVFIPSFRNERFSENITIPAVVNDQRWHTMHIQLQQSQAIFKVDNLTRSTKTYRKPLIHKEQVIFGFGLRGYKQQEGYVGCMVSIVIQGQKVEPLTVVESNAAVGLKLDGCYLVDHCNISNICEHDSKCLPDWDGVQCDCQGDHYEGKACHFSKYPATCNDYYNNGHKESGVYLIDVDRHGPEPPAYVQCSMGSERDGQLYGVTIIEHNLALSTPVRGKLLEDRRYELTYREMNRAQLTALAQTSTTCEQYFKYSCQHSPILLGHKTWFKSVGGQVVDYLGAAKSGHCACQSSQNGFCDGQKCYCDHGRDGIIYDEGYSHNKDQLPIMELIFLQEQSSSGTANMTLGPFTCWGSERPNMDNQVTLITEESHLMLHTWREGDMGFHFKTHQHNAILLMQTSEDTLFGNMFSVKIVSENSVEFYFRLNGTVIRKRLRVANPINEGDWHYIYIEQDPFNLRLSLDTFRVLVTLNSALYGAVDFDSTLYIGGLPQDVADKFNERTPGMSGCIRSFVYNGQEVALSLLVDDSTTGIAKGCMSSCWPNPCQYGGTCKEKWGQYTCSCQDPWAHQGQNCEHNLNLDAVTFSGKTHLMFDLPKQHSPLGQTIVLSFRTLQPDTLLLYAHDEMFNFVQMELQHKSTIVFSYNSHGSIVSGSITAPEPVNDGEWKQVIAQEYYNMTKLIYGEQAEIIEYRHAKLKKYSMNPFMDSMQLETVIIPHPSQQPSPFVKMYVGGVQDASTAIPFLKGCVRGMRIGNHHVNLGDGVRARGGDTPDLAAACITGCSKNPCMNSGYCNERWRYGNFTCDCSESDFSGKYCEKQASVLFDAQSVLKHTFTLPVAAQRSVTEQIILNFKTSGTQSINAQGNLMDMALIYIKSSEYNDYILARLDGNGNVLIETNQGVGIYRMRVSGNYADGKQHQLVYKREGTNMYLTLDRVKEARIVYPDHDLNQIDTILIGGLLMEDATQFEETVNFTGCIFNPVFIPEANLDLKIRSLKDFYLDDPSVLVHGPKVSSCDADMPTGNAGATPAPPAMEVPPDSFEKLTMPPWDLGPARLVTLSPPIQTEPATITTLPTSATTSNDTAAILMMQNAGLIIKDLAIIIGVAIVAFILLIILIIAICLLCKRTRHRYDVKKEMDIELKEPLTFPIISPIQSSPVPKDHLARLDEFSMISATLGPRPIAKPETANHVESSPNRNSVGSMPKADTDLVFEHPIFNKRKQRPASSISEVLEELERRQNAKNHAEPPEDLVEQPQKEEEKNWNPRRQPPTLSYTDISCFDIFVCNMPLMPPIPDEKEDSHISSLSEKNSFFEEKPEDSCPSADESQCNPNSLLDGNGDSGYEAESRPEVTEDDVTPTGEVDDLDEDDEITLPKYYIGNTDVEDSPVLVSPSRQRLLKTCDAE